MEEADPLLEGETLNWRTPDEETPPGGKLLFVRLEHVTDGIINFATSFYDPERGFLYARLEDIPNSGHGLLPPSYFVTHWALSRTANETETKYAWTLKAD
jgi:hypothetical protein